MTDVVVQGIDVTISDVSILSEISLNVVSGTIVGLVGPNGSGKTTLLRALHRALRPRAGVVSLGGDDLWQLSSRTAAQRIAVVAQEQPAEFEFTAGEVAAMGRIPYQRGFARTSREDAQLLSEALAVLGLTDLEHRPFSQMSGGERQRTMIARALVQQSTVLVLDEPTNHLDIRFQLDVLHRVSKLGLTTVAALHDLNLAASWCDLVYVIQRGRIVAGGPPEQTLTPGIVRDVFGVRAVTITHPTTGRPHLLFERDEERHEH